MFDGGNRKLKWSHLCFCILVSRYFVVPGIVTNLVVSTLSSSHLRLSWGEPIDKGCPEGTLQYKVSYKMTIRGQCEHLDGRTFVSRFTQTLQLDLHELEPLSTYLITVATGITERVTKYGAVVSREVQTLASGELYIIQILTANEGNGGKLLSPRWNSTLAYYSPKLNFTEGTIICYRSPKKEQSIFVLYTQVLDLLVRTKPWKSGYKVHRALFFWDT